MRILLIEDDQMLGKATKNGLKKDFSVDLFEDGESGLLAIDTEDYDVIVLDIGLPGISGLEFLKAIRKKGFETPVILLTARDRVENKIEGLDLGADDYLAKPFDLNELKARVRALGRRSHGRTEDIIEKDNVLLNLSLKKVFLNNNPIDLSAREFSLLTVLFENMGRCMSKSQIEDKLFGFDSDAESNIIEVHVSNIRKKLGKNLIKTVRGLGYIVEKN